MRRSFYLLPVVLLALSLAACDSGSDDEEDVSFRVSSVGVQLQGGAAGITFFGTPDNDVILTAVVITFPTGETDTFNAGSTTVVANEAIALQDPGTGYIRVSGEWQFEFRGNFPGGGSFTETTTVSVSA